MANTWFVMIPPAYVNKSDAEKELVDFRVQYPYPSQAWTDANAGRILSPSESQMGQQLVKWKGPFATEAEAQAAQAPKQQSPNPLNDAVNAAENSNLNPLNWLAKITGFSGTNFVKRSVKVIIGGVLLISGIIHLAGIDKQALGVASKVVIPA